jgi:carbon-monoxide dehydrogenase medium subunit
MAVPFDYHAAETWDEAVHLLRKYGPEAKPLAGGTDLMVLVERGQIQPRHVVSLDRIPGWDALKLDGSLTLGAGTTYRQLERIPALRGVYAALVEAARQVGSIQVRNVATVAGNFCNASPAADAVPPLLVMDATLTLFGPQGERVVPAETFITGPGQTVLREAELLREIKVASLPSRTATAFLKAGRRAAMEISIVCVAVRLTLAREKDVCQSARIALGAVAPTPVRAKQAEEALRDRRLTKETMEQAAELAVRATQPISDVRASADYRRYLTRVMVRRALEECLARISGSPPA